LSNLLADSSKAVFLSSQAGSSELRGKLPHMKPGGNIFYRISKAALNNAVANVAFDLHTNGHIACALHPGFVRTKSGGQGADLSVEQAVEKIKETVDKITLADSGKFISLDGKLIPF
jgi:NAD(P)-dependent dehydrogenase (short-subunit alcohol dehydrogenase family)